MVINLNSDAIQMYGLSVIFRKTTTPYIIMNNNYANGRFNDKNFIFKINYFGKYEYFQKKTSAKFGRQFSVLSLPPGLI